MKTYLMIERLITIVLIALYLYSWVYKLKRTKHNLEIINMFWFSWLLIYRILFTKQSNRFVGVFVLWIIVLALRYNMYL